MRAEASLTPEDTHNIISFIVTSHSVTASETPLLEHGRSDPAHAGQQPPLSYMATSCTLQHPAVLMREVVLPHGAQHQPPCRDSWPDIRATDLSALQLMYKLQLKHSCRL